jgi:hypothetical protein
MPPKTIFVYFQVDKLRQQADEQVPLLKRFLSLSLQ